MGCLFAIIAAFSPRFALVIVWLFTNLVDRAFNGILVPLLGLSVLPMTTLLYVLAYNPVTKVSGFGWVLVGLGVLVDLSAYGAAARRRG